MSKNYWITLVVIFLVMIATPGYFLYKTSHPVLSTVVLPDGTSIICPDPNYNPHYMDGGVMVSYDLNTGVTLTLIDGVVIDATIPGHMDR